MRSSQDDYRERASSSDVEFQPPWHYCFKLTLGWFLREFRVNDYFAAEYSALVGRTDYITNIISCVRDVYEVGLGEKDSILTYLAL